MTPFAVFGNVPVWKLDSDNSYVYLSGMQIDGDGAGGNDERDPDFQGETSLKVNGVSLNARKEVFTVLPMALMKLIGPVCLGCMVSIRDITTGIASPSVVADGGPNNKLGEHSIAAAKFFGINPDPVRGGTDDQIFAVQFWPGVPAIANGKTYTLQSL